MHSVLTACANNLRVCPARDKMLVETGDKNYCKSRQGRYVFLPDNNDLNI